MVLQLLMMLRAILSWLPFDDDTPLQRFLFYATEPIILPVRNLLSRSDFFNSLPIDVSFLVAYLLLSIVIYFLPAVHF